MRTITVPVTFFSVTSPVRKTSASLALVLSALRICRCMFIVGFQYNFRQITFRWRRLTVVSRDMMLFWCSWFAYRLIKLNLVTVGKFCFPFSRVLGSVVNTSVSAHISREAQAVCVLTKVGSALKLPHNSLKQKPMQTPKCKAIRDVAKNGQQGEETSQVMEGAPKKPS